MKVITICGSMRFAKDMISLASELEIEKGWCVLQCVYDDNPDKLTLEDIEKLSLLPNFNAFVSETRRTNLVKQTRSQLIRYIENADDDTLSRVATMLLPPKAKRLSLRSTEPDTSK